MKIKRYNLLIYIIIIGFIIFCNFNRVIFSEGILYGSDFILQFLPWKRYVYDYIRRFGTIPFWNPYLFSGIPFISNIQVSIFYPLGFLYYLIPPQSAYLFSNILHLFLGSIFFYLFMNHLSIGLIGSFVSSIIFIFNGFFMAHLYAGHLSFVQTYIWIPLIMLYLIKFFDSNPGRSSQYLSLVPGDKLKLFTEETFMNLIKKNARCLKHIPDESITEEMADIAIGRSGAALFDLPKEFRTKERIEKAVSKSPSILEDLPKAEHTSTLLLKATLASPKARKYFKR